MKVDQDFNLNVLASVVFISNKDISIHVMYLLLL